MPRNRVNVPLVEFLRSEYNMDTIVVSVCDEMLRLRFRFNEDYSIFNEDSFNI